MKKKLILIILLTNLILVLNSDDMKIEKYIETGVLIPYLIEARKFYNEKYFSDSEADEYLDLQDQYFKSLNYIDKTDIEIINKLSGSWSMFTSEKIDIYDFIDYKSAYKLIGFLHDSYYGFSVNFWGDGTFPLYKNQDYLVSTVGTMGWIGPILRYEFQDEKMYLYILNMDKWELADFHEGGKNYFIKTSTTHTPLTP